MPKLILGPLLRWVGGTQATVWVETDAPAVPHTYLAELTFPHEDGISSRAWQAVCSPLRNPLPASMRAAHLRAFRRAAAAVARRLARRARVPPEAVAWRVERAVTAPDGSGPSRLEPLYEHRLAGGPGDP